MPNIPYVKLLKMRKIFRLSVEHDDLLKWEEWIIL